MKPPRASLAALLLAQAQETFNDCAAKFMLIGVTQQLARAAGEDPKPMISLIALLLVLPYVLFAPVCGWLADRFPKRTVLNWTLVSQIGVMLLLVAALVLKSYGLAMTAFFLLSAETAVLAPAKRGILLEYVGERQLSRWVGYMEMLNITAILVGTFAGGWLFSYWLGEGNDVWEAGLKVAWLLTGLAVVAWALFQVAQPTKAQSMEPFRASLWIRHFKDVAEIWRE
ncbi:MAG TPA: MFS transporter, partial [Lacunisphaera sp.]|nr:MFS transporter [Lacunisphaera sp.]